MLKLEGRILTRARGTYLNKDGRERPKVRYEVLDNNGKLERITDFEPDDNPYKVDEFVSIPCNISIYQYNGKNRYMLAVEHIFHNNMEMF